MLTSRSAEASSDTMLKEREQVVTLDHFGQVVSCFRPLCGTEGDARSKNFVEKVQYQWLLSQAAAPLARLSTLVCILPRPERTKFNDVEKANVLIMAEHCVFVVFSK